MVGSANQAKLDVIRVCPACDSQYSDDVDVCPADGVRLLPADEVSVGRVGAVLGGRYHIKSVLGQGGMGTVFAATQEPIGRRVAVKVLHPDLASDKTFVSRFHTEAKAASVLVNPNTVTIHDFGQTDDGTLFIAMEHLEGVSLADRLEWGPLPWPHAVAIGIQVCRALAEAHRKGIVHRDLKPENIMLLAADDGSLLVKVLDFGIAKMMQGPGPALTGLPVTQVGVIIGTPQYMSPEQAQGKEPSSASDLYALGIILYEAISGAVPFDDDEHILLLGKHIKNTPAQLSSPADDLPPELANLAMSLLSKDAGDRPGPADHVGSSLRQIMGTNTVTSDAVIDPGMPTEESGLSVVATTVDELPDAEELDEDCADYAPTQIVHAPPEHFDETEESSSPHLPAPTAPAPIMGDTDQMPTPWHGDEEHEIAPTKRSPKLLIVAGIVVVLAGAVTGVAVWSQSGDEEPGGIRTVPLPPDNTQQRNGEKLSSISPNPGAQPTEPATNADAGADGAAEEYQEKVRVVLKSRPLGVSVYQDDEFLCKTPCWKNLPSGEVSKFRFYRKGFRSQFAEINPGEETSILVKMRRAKRRKTGEEDLLGLWGRPKEKRPRKR